MSRLPDRFQAGETLRDDIGPKLNALVDYVRGLTPHGDERTVRVQRLPGGSYFSAVGRGGGGGGGGVGLSVSWDGGTSTWTVSCGQASPLGRRGSLDPWSAAVRAANVTLGSPLPVGFIPTMIRQGLNAESWLNTPGYSEAIDWEFCVAGTTTPEAGSVCPYASLSLVVRDNGYTGVDHRFTRSSDSLFVPVGEVIPLTSGGSAVVVAYPPEWVLLSTLGYRLPPCNMTVTAGVLRLGPVRLVERSGDYMDAIGRQWSMSMSGGADYVEPTLPTGAATASTTVGPSWASPAWYWPCGAGTVDVPCGSVSYDATGHVLSCKGQPGPAILPVLDGWTGTHTASGTATVVDGIVTAAT